MAVENPMHLSAEQVLCLEVQEGEFEQLYNKIVDHLKAGGLVQITTYMRSTIYRKKHTSCFSVDANGVYVSSGKQRNKIAGAVGSLVSIRFGH